MTSNLNPDQLEQWFRYDEQGKPLDEAGRLFDRIIGCMQLVQVETASYWKGTAMKRIGRDTV